MDVSFVVRYDMSTQACPLNYQDGLVKKGPKKCGLISRLLLRFLHTLIARKPYFLLFVPTSRNEMNVDIGRAA
jgi:hypothetical protein